ncbi:MAG: formylglycine-generating enzyme family protein [Rikenellaceae bacterium]|nr:formylglycine-generating enzyme family protein [Rikenellaceae bacterium]
MKKKSNKQVQRSGLLRLTAIIALLLSSIQVANSQNYVENAGCDLGMKMVYVEGGTFTMGATSEQSGEASFNESLTHSVTLDSFYIGECEVTQAQWQKIMGTTVYQQRDKVYTSLAMSGVGDSHPMYYISWEDAQNFCRELSAITGKTYLLPTEAQWEYAARGGKHSKGYKYSGSYTIDAVAWYSDNSGLATHPVKQKQANELGLYDMSGNVWEWCSDWYGLYSSSSHNNPTGASSGRYRVLRGGGWNHIARNCRSSNRNRYAPSGRLDNHGFRVVCLP